MKRTKNLLGLPYAPTEVAGRTRRRFEALGRADARKYKNVQDFSRTHAILEAEAMAQAGQHRVNQWLVQMVQPIIAGNSRIGLQVREIQAELLVLSSTKRLSGRHDSQMNAKAESLKVDLAFLAAQHESNLRAIESMRLQAEAGFASWVGYFSSLCAIYSRSRTLEDKSATHDAPAQSPVFRPIELNPVGIDLPSLEIRG